MSILSRIRSRIRDIFRKPEPKKPGKTITITSTAPVQQASVRAVDVGTTTQARTGGFTIKRGSSGGLPPIKTTSQAQAKTFAQKSIVSAVGTLLSPVQRFFTKKTGDLEFFEPQFGTTSQEQPRGFRTTTGFDEERGQALAKTFAQESIARTPLPPIKTTSQQQDVFIPQPTQVGLPPSPAEKALQIGEKIPTPSRKFNLDLLSEAGREFFFIDGTPVSAVGTLLSPVQRFFTKKTGDLEFFEPQFGTTNQEQPRGFRTTTGFEEERGQALADSSLLIPPEVRASQISQDISKSIIPTLQKRVTSGELTVPEAEAEFSTQFEQRVEERRPQFEKEFERSSRFQRGLESGEKPVIDVRTGGELIAIGAESLTPFGQVLVGASFVADAIPKLGKGFLGEDLSLKERGILLGGGALEVSLGLGVGGLAVRSAERIADRSLVQELIHSKGTVIGDPIAKSDKGVVFDLKSVRGKGEATIKTDLITPVFQTGEDTFSITGGKGRSTLNFFSTEKGKTIEIVEDFVFGGTQTISKETPFQVFPKGRSKGFDIRLEPEAFAKELHAQGKIAFEPSVKFENERLMGRISFPTEKSSQAGLKTRIQISEGLTNVERQETIRHELIHLKSEALPEFIVEPLGRIPFRFGIKEPAVNVGKLSLGLDDFVGAEGTGFIRKRGEETFKKFKFGGVGRELESELGFGKITEVRGGSQVGTQFKDFTKLPKGGLLFKEARGKFLIEETGFIRGLPSVEGEEGINIIQSSGKGKRTPLSVTFQKQEIIVPRGITSSIERQLFKPVEIIKSPTPSRSLIGLQTAVGGEGLTQRQIQRSRGRITPSRGGQELVGDFDRDLKLGVVGGTGIDFKRDVSLGVVGGSKIDLGGRGGIFGGSRIKGGTRVIQPSAIIQTQPQFQPQPRKLFDEQTFKRPPPPIIITPRTGFDFMGGGDSGGFLFGLPPLPLTPPSRKGKRPKSKRTLTRTPSLVAAEFGRVAFKPLAGESSGLIERPIIKKRKKKRSKK